MVNYKRVVCEVAVLLVVLAITTAAPAPAPDCPHAHYDQRQNGTENVRVNIDGVVIAIAPAETLLEAASDIGDYIDQSSIEVLFKPPSEQSSIKPEVNKPESEKPLSDVSLNSNLSAQKKDASVRKQEKAQRLKHRLASAIIPLLRRTLHQ